MSKFINFLLVLWFPCVLLGQSEEGIDHSQKPSREFCQQLMDEAWEKSNNENYAGAIENLLNAEIIADEYNWNDKLWLIQNQMGITYSGISSYGDALQYFNKSLSIIQSNSELKSKTPIALSSIGALFATEGKYDDALDYMLRAYTLLKKDRDENGLIKNTANNIAYLYNELGKSNESLQILKQVETLEGGPKIDFLWETQYIKALLVDGQIEKAQKLGEALFIKSNTISQKNQRESCDACIALVLSEIYTELVEFDKAIDFLKLALANSDDLSDKIDFYEDISNLYFNQEQFEIAYKYKDSVLSATNELSSRINKGLFEMNKVKLKVEEYKNEITQKKKQNQNERRFFLILLIAGIVFILFLYKTLKNRVDKQKQKALIAKLEFEKKDKEHLLSKKELEMTKLKQNQLNLEIAQKNRELSTKALYLTSRNELINEIIKSLENNNEISHNSETAKQIRAIKNFLKSDSQHKDFIFHFEKVNPNFIKNLKRDYPKLTTNDLRFLCYIYMNLTLKEISVIFNITYDACRIRRNRIADKMGVNRKNISLYDFLLKLSD